MKKFLKKVVIDGGLQEQIAVQDATLGKAIKVFISLGPNGGLESFRQGFFDIQLDKMDSRSCN